MGEENAGELVEEFYRRTMDDSADQRELFREFFTDGAEIVTNGDATVIDFDGVPDGGLFDAIEIEQKEIIDHGDRAVLWITGRMEQIASVYGVDPVDSEIRLHQASLFEVEDGKFSRVSHVFDRSEILEQLGLIATDPHVETIKNQYYAILNRVLRHNLRNELAVVEGQAEMLVAGEQDPETAADVIRSATAALQETAEKARSLQQRAIETEIEPQPVDVGAFVESFVDSQRAGETPASAVDVAVEAPVTVTTDDSLLGIILEELLENATEHTSTSTVRVAVGPADDGQHDVRIAVSDDGPGIAPDELEPIGSGEETALLHGSGIGLWLVEWGVTRLHGDVTFDTGSDGTTVTVYLSDMSE